MLTRLTMTAILFFLAMITQVLANPASNDPSMEIGKQIINEETFTEFKSVKDIPQSVKDEFIKLSQNSIFMADPGQSFAIGCIRSENQPSRRLIFGAVNSNHCLLFYEKSGYARQYLIAVFELDAKTCRPIWKRTVNFDSAPKVRSFGDLKQLLNAGKTSEPAYL